MAETKKKRRRKKINVVRLFTTVVIATLIMVVGFSVKNIIDLHNEQRELKLENEKLNAEKNQLATELENVNDPGYIEEQARKQLKMIKPGEVLYVLDDVAKSAGAEGESADGGESEGQSG